MVSQEAYDCQYLSMKYIHCCLYETSKVLQQVIIHTYKHRRNHEHSFFLVGYKRGSSGRYCSIFKNPETAVESGNFRLQLKNLRFHMSNYAEYMNLYDDVLDDITGFLLHEVIDQCFLGSKKMTYYISNKQFLFDCIESCQELVSAVKDGEFYNGIRKVALEATKNIDLLLHLAESCEVPGRNVANLDTSTVLRFLQSDSLRSALEGELDNRTDTTKPLTNTFLSIIIPHVQMLTEDSGVFANVDGQSNASTPFRGCLSLPTTRLDASMVIVDTPVKRNKTIGLLKDQATKSHQKRANKSDEMMDGSFVLI